MISQKNRRRLTQQSHVHRTRLRINYSRDTRTHLLDC